MIACVQYNFCLRCSRETCQILDKFGYINQQSCGLPRDKFSQASQYFLLYVKTRFVKLMQLSTIYLLNHVMSVIEIDMTEKYVNEQYMCGCKENIL